VYVAASNDMSERPFPFAVKEKLAKVSGVPKGRFVQVKSPFRPAEITNQYDPDSDVLIFVRSEKDRNEQPKPGGTKKDGSLAYFQPYTGKDLKPFSKHAYIAYLPTVEFGPGIKSATEIRNAWPTLDDRRKTAMVMSLYPSTQKNPKLAANVVKMLDMGMGNELDEGLGSKLGAAALAGSLALGGLSQMGKTATTNWNDYEQEISGSRDSSGNEKIMSVAGPNSKGEYRVRITTDNDMQEFITKTPPKSLDEARTNPEQNVKLESGMKELEAVANNISDPENWAVSMTSEPKLGINPQVGISEDTPKGIYFYPLNYVLDKIHSRKPLPWGNDYPYIQLFQYDRSGEMTRETEVDPAKLKQALSQYCSDEVIQQAIDDPEYDGTPYWTIYDCLSRLGKGDETNVIRWNKVLRDLGFTSVYDPGNGWIAYNEPTQGVVLDPRIIKQHKTISNRKESKVITPARIAQLLFDEIDMELARNRIWQLYDPDGSKLRQAAKKYAEDPKFKPYMGKPGSQELEDKIKGYRLYGARQLSDVAMEWYKAQQKVDEDKDADPVTSAVLSFYKPVVNDIHKEKLPDYVDQARGLLQKTNDPDVRSKLVDIFKKGKENPYIQGGIVTTVGAVLAGGILNTAQQMGLSPAQTNLALQAILNTVIPTVVSRINGKNWSDTIKYTLASAGIGTGIAGASLIETDRDPWGDQGNFAGDRPVNIGGSFTRTKLGVGDMVKVNAGHFKGIGEISEIKDDRAEVWMSSYSRSFVFDLSDLVKYIPESIDYLEEK
jgi:hypothetical protein